MTIRLFSTNYVPSHSRGFFSPTSTCLIFSQLRLGENRFSGYRFGSDFHQAYQNFWQSVKG